MNRSDLSKGFYKNLKCLVLVAGGATEGESIVFSVYGDDQPVYVCVIDSCVYGETNIPEMLLKQYGLSRLSDVFWTHPHEDHTEGMLDLIEKYKPDRVFIPSDLHSLPECCSQLCRDTLDGINKFKGCDRRYKNQPKVIGIGTNHQVLKERLSVNNSIVPFSIQTIAPALARTRNNAIIDNYNCLNDFSIALYIVVGDFVILFAGDIQDKTVHYVKDELVEGIVSPNLLKIPHHGSNDSKDIIELFYESCPIDLAICTAKSSSGLPRKDALDFYASSSKRMYRIEENIQGIAVWGAEIDIVNAQINEIENRQYQRYK